MDQTMSRQQMWETFFTAGSIPSQCAAKHGSVTGCACT